MLKLQLRSFKGKCSQPHKVHKHYKFVFWKLWASRSPPQIPDIFNVPSSMKCIKHDVKCFFLNFQRLMANVFCGRSKSSKLKQKNWIHLKLGTWLITSIHIYTHTSHNWGSCLSKWAKPTMVIEATLGSPTGSPAQAIWAPFRILDPPYGARAGVAQQAGKWWISPWKLRNFANIFLANDPCNWELYLIKIG